MPLFKCLFLCHLLSSLLYASEQGVVKSININKLISTDCEVKIWIADWFAQLNNKMAGELKKIKVIGQYFIEQWKAVGMNLETGQVGFFWTSHQLPIS